MNRRGCPSGSDLDLSFTESALLTLNRNGTTEGVSESWGRRAEPKGRRKWNKVVWGVCVTVTTQQWLCSWQQEQHTGTELLEDWVGGSRYSNTEVCSISPQFMNSSFSSPFFLQLTKGPDIKKGGSDLQRELIKSSALALAPRAVLRKLFVSELLPEVCSEMPWLPPVELEESKAAVRALMESGCRTNPRALQQAEGNLEQSQGFARAALELFGPWADAPLGRAVLGGSGKVWSCSAVAQVRDLFLRSRFGQLTPSCSRTNCMFLSPSSSSASSDISGSSWGCITHWGREFLLLQPLGLL